MSEPEKKDQHFAISRKIADTGITVAAYHNPSKATHIVITLDITDEPLISSNQWTSSIDISRLDDIRRRVRDEFRDSMIKSLEADGYKNINFVSTGDVPHRAYGNTKISFDPHPSTTLEADVKKAFEKALKEHQAKIAETQRMVIKKASEAVIQA